MRERFKNYNFRDGNLEKIAISNAIIGEYSAENMKLTVRQLYYQFVARGYIENNQREYNKLSALISRARLAGLIDWGAIEDRTRNLERQHGWNSPHELIDACARQYHRDLWETQEYRVEVWIEKEALSGVIAVICEELRVPYLACRGYVSQSELYDGGKRLAGYIYDGYQVVVLHLGDHDPSGIDMTRDNKDRLDLFSDHDIEVIRLALNYDQVEKYNPPPDPAKSTDSRFLKYYGEYGGHSWELDALDPLVIRELIRDSVSSYIDRGLWDDQVELQEYERKQIKEAARRVGDYDV